LKVAGNKIPLSSNRSGVLIEKGELMKHETRLSSTRNLVVIALIGCMISFQSCRKDDPDPPIQINFSSTSFAVSEGNQINVTLQLSRPATREGMVKN
jgi:hypothetical protein